MQNSDIFQKGLLDDNIICLWCFPFCFFNILFHRKTTFLQSLPIMWQYMLRLTQRSPILLRKCDIRINNHIHSCRNNLPNTLILTRVTGGSGVPRAITGARKTVPCLAASTSVFTVVWHTSEERTNDTFRYI